MVIVSDTSVITYLIQLGHIDLLPTIFGEVIIPQVVENELNHIPSQKDLLNTFSWLKTIAVEDNSFANSLHQKLDLGEAEAIAIAIQLNADMLLIDEKKRRKIAKDFGLSIIGLLGILKEAKQAGLIDKLKPLLNRLIYEIGFRISPNLYNRVLASVDES